MAKKKTYPASDIAKYFIYRANHEHKPITNKKLQKLLYYAQAWSLAARKKELFNEKIEAWVHGPAIRDIYVQYKEFGFDPIKEKVTDRDISVLGDEERGLLDEIWTIYGKHDAGYLERLTHSEVPWLAAREGLDAKDGSHNEITHASMRKFYGAKLKK